MKRFLLLTFRRGVMKLFTVHFSKPNVEILVNKDLKEGWEVLALWIVQKADNLVKLEKRGVFFFL